MNCHEFQNVNHPKERRTRYDWSMVFVGEITWYTSTVATVCRLKNVKYFCKKKIFAKNSRRQKKHQKVKSRFRIRDSLPPGQGQVGECQARH